MNEKDVQAVAEVFCRYFALHRIINEYTGEHVRDEDFPGNYQVVETAKGIRFRLFGRDGRPIDLPLDR